MADFVLSNIKKCWLNKKIIKKIIGKKFGNQSHPKKLNVQFFK
jgi:hypothetical protein